MFIKLPVKNHQPDCLYVPANSGLFGFLEKYYWENKRVTAIFKQ